MAHIRQSRPESGLGVSQLQVKVVSEFPFRLAAVGVPGNSLMDFTKRELINRFHLKGNSIMTSPEIGVRCTGRRCGGITRSWATARRSRCPWAASSSHRSYMKRELIEIFLAVKFTTQHVLD